MNKKQNPFDYVEEVTDQTFTYIFSTLSDKFGDNTEETANKIFVNLINYYLNRKYEYTSREVFTFNFNYLGSDYLIATWRRLAKKYGHQTIYDELMSGVWNRHHSEYLTILDFAAKIRLITDDFSTQANQKNISIESRLPESALICANSIAVGQVIENIVSNAVKYTFPGKRVVISLREFAETHPATLESTDIKYRFIVEAESPDLPHEEFRPNPLHSILNITTSRGYSIEWDRSGLGFSNFLRLVEAINGKVWYERQWGVGPRFIVELAKVS